MINKCVSNSSIPLISKPCNSIKSEDTQNATSIAAEEDAIVDPQLKVLKQASTIRPDSSSILICSFVTSPQAGAPIRPVPTFGSFLSKEPTRYEDCCSDRSRSRGKDVAESERDAMELRVTWQNLNGTRWNFA